MTEPTHTPTPWKAEDEFSITGPVYGVPDALIATFGGIHINTANQRVLRAEKDANRSFVLLACNSHDALVEACETLQQQLTDLHAAIADQWLGAHFVDSSIDMLSEGRTAIDAARAALAKARPESTVT